MIKPAKPLRVVVVGPGPKAQGGITAVIENYHKTEFWSKYGCTHFASTSDFDTRLMKALFGVWRLLAFCSMVVTSGRPAAVSVHASHSGSFYRKLAYLALCKLFRIPAVLHIHPAAFYEYYETGSQLRRRLIRLAGLLSARVLFLSAEIQSKFRSIFPESKMRVLGNPVDIDTYQSSRDFPRSKRPTVLFLGWIVPEKGVYDLVQCIPLIKEKVPNVMFLFAGNKEVDKLRHTLADHGFRENSEVLGWIEGDRKLELLGSSWLLCLPSYTEGVPNVLLEAMASRLPIVCSAVGGIPSILEHARTAEFIKPGNVDNIVVGINKVLLGPDYARDLAENAYSHVRQEFSCDVISSRLDEIYAEVLSPTE